MYVLYYETYNGSGLHEKTYWFDNETAFLKELECAKEMGATNIKAIKGEQVKI